jgi:hypothetical protein
VSHAQKNSKLQPQKTKRKICSRLAAADQDGQKNRNGKMIAVLFHNVFYQ